MNRALGTAPGESAGSWPVVAQFTLPAHAAGVTPARFATTRWSQVSAAGSGARAAMAWLCTAYWDPLRAHVQRRGFRAEDCDDLTQDFLLSVVQGGIVERADRMRGRFRTFLLACLDHHLGHARERAAAAKRGGDVRHVEAEPLADPRELDAGFDRDWALAVLARARARLRADSEAARHDLLAPFLSANGDAAAYAAVGKTLGLEAGAVRVAVHRLRARFADCLRQEVAETLADATPEAIDAEIADLLAALRGTSR